MPEDAFVRAWPVTDTPRLKPNTPWIPSPNVDNMEVLAKHVGAHLNLVARAAHIKIGGGAGFWLSCKLVEVEGVETF